ncbi:hypothetical protein FHX14_000595 [Rhizobium sp. BK619]|nr:hypothetical protein [Rhizobium sp. BK619]
MAQLMGKLGFELNILADYILDEIKKAERIFADETTLPTCTWFRISEDGMAMGVCQG